MKIAGFILLILLPLVPVNCQCSGRYCVFPGIAVIKGSHMNEISIRRYERGNRLYFLVVNPETLKTRLVSSDSAFAYRLSWEMLRFLFPRSNYLDALDEVREMDSGIQDAGYTGFTEDMNGVTLTIDLCPSSKTLDRDVFRTLLEETGRYEKPVPLSVSVTGKWMEDHENDLLWLKRLIAKGDIDILWVNHTLNHHTYPGKPLDHNFLLADGTNIDNEVLGNEKAIIYNGLCPSVFFRFPGLVSDSALYYRIISYGLIPVGSDAWLAKGEYPSNGSIILIHANGNEPAGIGDFIRFIKTRENVIKAGTWKFLDLRENISNNRITPPYR